MFCFYSALCTKARAERACQARLSTRTSPRGHTATSFCSRPGSPRTLKAMKVDLDSLWKC